MNKLTANLENSDKKALRADFCMAFLDRDYEIKKDIYTGDMKFTDPARGDGFTVSRNTDIRFGEQPLEVSNFIETRRAEVIKEALSRAGLRGCGDKDARLECYEARRLNNPIMKYLHDLLMDKAHLYSELMGELRQEPGEKLLDAGYCGRLAEKYGGRFKACDFDRAEEERLEDRLYCNKQLARTNPYLAALKMVEQSFERDGDGFAASINGKEAVVNEKGFLLWRELTNEHHIGDDIREIIAEYGAPEEYYSREDAGHAVPGQDFLEYEDNSTHEDR